MTADEGPTLPVILAAGLGTRMRSRLPKLLHVLLGRPMLAYVVDAAVAATGARPLIVYSPATAAICATFADAAEFALQDEPRGTGDALRAALVAVPGDVAELLVMNGDVPLVEADLLGALTDRRRDDGAVIALLSVDAVDPGRLGRVVRATATRRRRRGAHRRGEGREPRGARDRRGQRGPVRDRRRLGAARGRHA